MYLNKLSYDSLNIYEQNSQNPILTKSALTLVPLAIPRE